MREVGGSRKLNLLRMRRRGGDPDDCQTVPRVQTIKKSHFRRLFCTTTEFFREKKEGKKGKFRWRLLLLCRRIVVSFPFS